ncbi:MAG: FAD-dependent oxidoreductase [Pseudomonadota bacterium]
MSERKKDIVVVGAGVGGVKAALDLAEIGHDILLVDRAPVMGGVLNRLDNQFPNNHCGFCRLLPRLDRDAGSEFCLKKGFIHHNVEFLGQTEVVAVDGPPGRLQIELETSPPGVDPLLCDGCGACAAVCPVETPLEFNAGLETRKAIYRPAPHHALGPYIIDRRTCVGCGACRDACPTGAVDLSADRPVRQIVQAGAVILASGIDYYHPAQTDVYGFGELENVVTAEAFERIISGTGPYEGRLVRPSDRRPARRIGWVQCVGSRNLMLGADYCSSICCMFAVKEAVLARERFGPEAEASIFYMDMRTFGRDFQRLRDRAENDLGVRFIRCRVHGVEPGDAPGELKIRYVDQEGRLQAEYFDLVVLSNGRDPRYNPPAFADREGVFVLDSAKSLTDIAGTVIGAGDAAARASVGLAASRRDRTGRPEAFSPFLDKKPMVLAAFWAPSEQAWAGLDVNGLAARPLEGRVRNVMLTDTENACPMPALKEKMAEFQANRLLLVSPTKRAVNLDELSGQLGLPRSHIELVDAGAAPGPNGAAGLSREMAAAVGKLVARRHFPEKPCRCVSAALVVGGGPAGLAAALTLAERGVAVRLVEKTGLPGGSASRMLSSEKKKMVEQLTAEVMGRAEITVHTRTEAVRCLGATGDFVVELKSDSGRVDAARVGAIILAPGEDRPSRRPSASGPTTASSACSTCLGNSPASLKKRSSSSAPAPGRNRVIIAAASAAGPPWNRPSKFWTPTPGPRSWSFTGTS